MKKNCKKSNFARSGISKILNVVKLVFFLILFSSIQVFAKVYSQQLTIVVNKNNITLEKAVDIIETKTGYKFLYSENSVNIKELKSIHLKNPDLKTLVNKVFGENFKFRIVQNKIVVISPNKVLPKKKIQQIKIKVNGVVKDSKGQPVPFANVLIMGKTQGVATDINGKYSIESTQKIDKLVFSCLGYKKSIISVNGKKIINAVLQEETTQMDEVMVVAYGVAKKSSFTGSAEVVKEETLKAASTISPIKAMEGAVSGVRITQTTGQPGSGISVNVRGIGSINGNTQPLYVIDGIPVVNNNYSNQLSSDPMALINPDDIKNITILKDAAATSLYGSRAANGVVLVTTKSGKKGKTRINVSVEQGISDYAMPGQKSPFLNAGEYAKFAYEGLYNKLLYDNGYLDYWDYNNPEATQLVKASKTLTPDQEKLYRSQALKDLYYKANLFHPNDPQDGTFDYTGLSSSQWNQMLNPKHYNWNDKLLRIGKLSKYDVNVQGGNSKLNYYASLGYFKQEGIVIGSDYERFTSKLSVNAKINKNVKFSLGEILSYGIKSGQNSGDFYHSNPIYAMFYLNPTAKFKINDQNNPNPGYSNAYPNPIDELKLLSNKNYQFRSITNGSLDIKILDCLQFKSTNAVDITSVDDKETAEKEARSIQANGYVAKTSRVITDLTTSNIFSFRKSFGNHNFSGVAGFEVNRYHYKDFSTTAINVSSNKLLYLSNASKVVAYSENEMENNLISYLSKVDYNYGDKYFFGTSLRRDGSSKLGPDSRWGNFYSVSAGWIFSKENYMDKDWLDFGKLTMSFGTTGNLPNGAFVYKSLYNLSGKYNGNPISYLSQPGNENLTWEYSKTTNLALEIRFLKRFKMGLETYFKYTDGLLNYEKVTGTTGFSEILVNKGAIKNTGIEFDFDAKIIKDLPLKWDVNFNCSYMKAVVDDLTQPIISRQYIYEEGKDLYSFYLRKWAGVDSNNGLPMWYDKDGKKTYNFYESPREVVGKGYPDIYGGLTNKISYKNFDLSFLITFSLGADLYDPVAKYQDGVGIGSYNIYSNYAQNYWTGGKAERPRVIYTNGIVNPDYSSAMTTRVLIDGDYARLKNIRLSYNLPKTFCSKFNVEGARLYFNATDVFTLFKYDHLNPETNMAGVLQDPKYFPLLKTVKLGINLNF